ncbi:MAG TPA: DUF1674 domain-containing protein [Sphingomicrobium sp.]
MRSAARHLGAMKRPDHVRPPTHLSPSPPVPEPEPVAPPPPPSGEEQRLDPTRYGDWEKKGIAVDF